MALLIYTPDRPQHAVYYPFTHFSPEWQALRYALERGIPARFMDLPQAVQLAKIPTLADQRTNTAVSMSSTQVPDLPGLRRRGTHIVASSPSVSLAILGM